MAYQRTVILGAGGHAKALQHVLSRPDILLESDADVQPDDQVYIGVGDMEKRRKLFAKFSAQIPNRGVQQMGNVWIGPDVSTGVNVLINTGAQIDHDCVIGDHCIIAPGAILCGGVSLGEACFIGAGTIILEGVELEPETFVSAGTLVVGPDDMRRPIRMVRLNGADQVDLRAEGADFYAGTPRQRHHPDS